MCKYFRLWPTQGVVEKFYLHMYFHSSFLLPSLLINFVYYYTVLRLKIFEPSLVYDHLGEIFSALIFGSFVFCIFLYIKVSALGSTQANLKSFVSIVKHISNILYDVSSRVKLHHLQVILGHQEILLSISIGWALQQLPFRRDVLL